MARTRKENLDYFPFDADFFFDTKIRRLKSKHGTVGVLVYQYILCSIYRTKGYYLIFDGDFIFELSEYFNIGENSIIEMIDFMKSKSLLVEITVDSKPLLTSVGVQRRYQEAKREISKKSRAAYQVDGRIWLLKNEETIDAVTISSLENLSPANGYLSPANGDLSPANAANKSKVNKSKLDESKVNESKVNESKVNESKVDESRVVESRVNESRVVESRVNKTEPNNTTFYQTEPDNTQQPENELNQTEPDYTTFYQIEPDNTQQPDSDINKTEPDYTTFYQTEPDYTEPYEDNVNDLTQTSDLTSPNNKTHLLIPCSDGFFSLDEHCYDELRRTYPDMMIDDSLKKLCSYLNANPGKQRKKSSIVNYILMWLGSDNEAGKYRKKFTSLGYSHDYSVLTRDFDSHSIVS